MTTLLSIVSGIIVDNQDVAAILEEIADLLDIEGESLFKVQAYRRAANGVRSLADDISEVCREGSLQKISGIGKGIAEKIKELLVTGEIEYFEELKEKIPPSLVELVQIPSLGPKKAKVLYEKLNIQTVDDLLDMVNEHKVAPIKGFGPKAEENILKGIKLLRKSRERILLSEAYPLAEKIIAELKKSPFVIRADMAGSLRRMKETIGDIDILASADDPIKVSNYFCELEMVDRVLAGGDTKASIIAKNGLQVDLRVVVQDQYGSALQYFTGSKEHNIHLRDIAKKEGLKINEYGLYSIDPEKRIGGYTEEEIYEYLQMQYIPPVMREDKGEIELAKQRKLPKLIEIRDIKGDLHVHSSWSDGYDEIKEMAGTAKEVGYSYIAICDHAENLKVAGGLSRTEVADRKREIDRINDEMNDFTVLNGIELNIDSNGKLDYDDEFLETFDVVVASIHAGFNQPEDQITKRTIEAIKNPHVNIIAHPTGRILGRRPPYAINLRSVFKAAAETGTILELNSYPDRLDLNDDYLREAKEQGVRIAINTDAHSKAHLKYVMYGVATAQRGWLEARDVVNTYMIEELHNMLRK